MAEDRFRNQGMGSGSNLPPWLQGVPLPANPSPVSSQPPHSAAEASSSVGALPDWLSELQSDVSDQNLDTYSSNAPAASEAQPPDWLANLASESAQPNEPAQEARSEDNAGVPDWLRELSSLADEPSSTTSQTPPSQNEGLPGWLQNMPSEPEPFPAETAAPASRDEGLPAWLQNMSDEPAPFVAPDKETSSSQEETLPGWLQGMPEANDSANESSSVEPPAESSAAAQPRVRLPVGATDWLRSLGEQPEAHEPPRPAEPQPPSTADDDDGVPAWLRDVSSDELERDLAESASQSSESSQPEDFSLSSEGEVDAPSWLMSDAEVRDKDSDDAMPEWLRTTASPSFSDDLGLRSETTQADEEPWTPEAVEELPQTELPSWLRAATSENPPPVSLADDDQRIEVEPPSWLQTPDTNSIPSWLQGADDELPARDINAAAQPTTEPDLPDWLGNSKSEPPDDSSQEEAAIPSWLQSDEPATPRTPGFSSPHRQDDDLPSWLQVESSETPQMPEAHEAPAPVNDLPDWLRSGELAEIQDRVGEPDEIAQQPVLPVDDEPPWLRANADTTAQPEPVGQEEDIPDWLRPSTERVDEPALPQNDQSLPDWLHSDEGSATGRDAGLPAWLRGAETSAPPPPSIPATPPRESGPALPPWLQEEQEESEPETVQQNGASDFLGLGGTDLPSWLRSSDAPTAPDPLAAPVGETYSDWIARLRTQQDEEAESDVAVAEPPTLTALQRPVYAVTPQRMEAIALLQQLVADPFPTPVAAPTSEGAIERRRFGLEQGLYLLLLVVLLLGLLMPQLTASFEGPIVAPGADQIAQRIDQLGENDVVLVAYEWDVRRRGELAPLEQSVMNHLAQRKVKFVFVSTDLQGTLLSYDARDRLISQFNYRTRGLDYILLGYKPGGELALRQMAQSLPTVLASDFQGADANQSAVALDVATGQPRLNSIRDFAMVVMMADEAQDVQAWMEQVRPQMNVNTPLVLLMPTETTPVVQPYLRQPGVLSLSGRQGALAYEQQRGGDASAVATAASGQVPFAIISFSVLLIVGALIGVLTTAAQRRR